MTVNRVCRKSSTCEDFLTELFQRLDTTTTHKMRGVGEAGIIRERSEIEEKVETLSSALPYSC